MAKKAAKKSVKKTAKKVAKKATKKAAKKVAKKAVKKVAKKVVKKVAKKAAKKAARNKSAFRKVKVEPTYQEIEQTAYFIYEERIKYGKSGDSQSDWMQSIASFAE